MITVLFIRTDRLSCINIRVIVIIINLGKNYYRNLGKNLDKNYYGYLGKNLGKINYGYLGKNLGKN